MKNLAVSVSIAPRVIDRPGTAAEAARSALAGNLRGALHHKFVGDDPRANRLGEKAARPRHVGIKTSALIQLPAQTRAPLRQTQGADGGRRGGKSTGHGRHAHGWSFDCVGLIEARTKLATSKPRRRGQRAN